MKAKDFVNRDEYVRIANLGHHEYYKQYLMEKYPLPTKPPKHSGLVDISEGIPVLYIHKDMYPDYERWLTDEKKEELREKAIKDLELARDELDEEYEELADKVEKIVKNPDDLGWKDE